MPRGGLRAGAGRPKGAKSPKAQPIKALPTDIRRAARQSGVSPLDYMLAVMNDAEADAARRDRMAMAAAPYVHPKPTSAPEGKKEAAQREAGTAGEDSEWGGDLQALSVN